MRYYRLSLIILLSFISFSCTQEPASTATYLFSAIPDTGGIQGKEAYLNSPYITPGNRVYTIGHQDGSFPDIGWHITGEMGGIWNHPIKLMDGFEAKIMTGDTEVPLSKATSFTNYPFYHVFAYEFPSANLQVRRLQFAPDEIEGLLVTYEILNTSNEPLTGTFQIRFDSDLRPTWLGERTDMIDAEDIASFDTERGVWHFKDSDNPWFALVKSQVAPDTTYLSPNIQTGLGASGTSHYSLEIGPGELTYLPFYIAGSYRDEELANANMEAIFSKDNTLFTRKQEKYKSISETAHLTTPDTTLNKTFKWLKYNADWFVRTVPEIGTGMVAGYPDYPWWFGCDSEYALQGYMAIGQQQTALQTIALLHRLSEEHNGNGRIVHEVSSNGAVFNPGNLNETPQFATLVWDVYQWTGDKQMLESYFPTIQKGFTWLMEEHDKDGDMLPEGAGMMEIHGLENEMIDVVSYTFQGYEAAAKIAKALQQEETEQIYLQKASQLKAKINQEFWSEEFNSYADFIGNDEQGIRLIEDAIIRADTLDKPWAVQELEETKRIIQNAPSEEERPFVVYHNWVVNTPMEVGAADPEKAKRALQTGAQFTNPFGMFVTGIDRDDSAGSDEGSFQGSKQFSYTGAVMTLPTGVQARGENIYGNPDQALAYLQKMNRTFSFALPGSMYEVSPDYGMFAQAWNIYSYAIPIVRQFFGVDPDAASKQIRIQTKMPTSWASASLENIPVGENSISIYYTKGENQEIQLTVNQSQPDWTLLFSAPNGYESRDTPTEEYTGKTITLRFFPLP